MNINRNACLIASMLMASSLFGVSEYYVSTSGNDSTGIGTSDNPFKTLARALSGAGDGCIIHLAPGTYTISTAIEITDALTITGDGASPADVVVQGNNSFRIFKLDNADAKLLSMTIMKGRVYGSSASNLANGGNVLITGAGGTVSNCVIASAQHIYNSRGAGVYVESENGVVTDSVIRDCYLTDGNGKEGTAFGITAGRIERCLITGNSCRTYASPNSNHGVGYIAGGLVKNCTIADNIHGKNILYVRGGEIRNCVIARNYTLRTAVSSHIDITAALKGTAFVDSVWDQGDLNTLLPKGDVKFVDFAAGDFRLAAGSAGAFDNAEDWGYVNCQTHVPAAAEPQSVTVEPGDDVRTALKRVADGGAVILKTGTHRVSSEPLRLVRPVTLTGETGNAADVILTKGSVAPAGPLVATANADAAVTGITLCDNQYNGNNTSSGIHMMYGGGVVSNCVLRKFGATSNAHGGTALRVEFAGAHVTRCVISNNLNHANTSTGGAIYISADSLIDNCLIADCNNDTWNSPTSNHWPKDTPGAIYQSGGTIANCTIVNCKAPRSAVAKTTGGVIRDTIIFGNERTNTAYPESEAVGTGAGTNNWSNIVSDIVKIGTDSVLATSETIGFVDAAGGDWRLAADSVARNAGPKRPLAGISKIDLAGNPRRVTPRVDAGCYERPGSPVSIIVVK